MKFLVEIAGRERVVDTTALSAVEVEPGIYSIVLDGRSHELVVREWHDGTLHVHLNGRRYVARVRDPRRLSRRRPGVALEGAQTVAAPMPGKIVRLLVGEGEHVEEGQGLLVVEAMKMQNEIKSPKAGAVVKIMVGEGATVNSGQALLTVE
jgi:biotin carboxyl carrier protein